MAPKDQVYAINVIFDKADTNSNGTLEYEEIHQWMHKLERHVIQREINKNV